MTKTTIYLPTELDKERTKVAAEKTMQFFDVMAVQIAPQGTEIPIISYLVDCNRDDIHERELGTPISWFMKVVPVLPTEYHAMQSRDGLLYMRHQKHNPYIDLVIGDTYYMFSQDSVKKELIEKGTKTIDLII